MYSRMTQAGKVLLLSEMEQAVAGLSLFQVLVVETQFQEKKGLRQGTKIMGLKKRENCQPCFSCIPVPLIVMLKVYLSFLVWDIEHHLFLCRAVSEPNFQNSFQHRTKVGIAAGVALCRHLKV